MDKTQKHVKISGRVQGVGFRHFTRQNAQDLGITGWVRNERNGDVEAVLQGDEENVQKMIERLRSGPRTSRVDDLRVEDGINENTESCSGFFVKR